LIEEVDVGDADAAGKGELQIGVALDLFRHRPVEEVGDVDLAALEHRESRGRLRHALVDDALHRRRLRQ